VKKGYLYIGLAALLFSTMEIALRLYSLGLNPIELNFLRFSVGALVLLPLAIKSMKGRAKLNANDLGFFALSGFVCVVLSMTLYQLAVVRSRASVVAVIFSCNPVFVVPLAALVLKERITPRTIFALVASLAGIACIALPAFRHAGGAGLDLTGVLLTVASAIVFAVYGVFGKARSSRYGGLALTSFSFVAGSLELLALIGISHIAPISGALRGAGLAVFADIPVFAGLTLQGLPGFLYLGIFVTGLGYAFYFLGMEHTSAQTGSVVFFIKPALAPLLALLVLGEAISLSMAGGIALILAGSAIMLSGRTKAGKAA
jgi:drug/metabolite transporter (DMT)-like permease